MTQKPAVSASVPLDKLGLPGAAYQLYAQGRKKGEPPQPPRQDLQDNYTIVLTLSRAMSVTEQLSFESQVAGDSHIQLVKPKEERTPADPDELVIFFGHGSQKLEMAGKANDQGRLSKISVQAPAASFPQAENIAFGAISPFLSAVAFPTKAVPGTVDSGETPVTMRWDYNALSNRDKSDGNPNIGVIIPASGVVAGVYVQAISAYAPHPNAARLWMEYLYSDEGQIIWLKGYGHPVRYADLAARNIIPADVASLMPPAAFYAKAVFPTIAQQTAAKQFIADNWDKVVNVTLQKK